MREAEGSRVEVLGSGDVPDVVSVLAEAFFEYPVMRFVLGAGSDYGARLDELVTFFVKARVLRGEVLLGVRSPGGLGAAALVSHPGRGENPPELATLREETWARLGPGPRARYEAFGSAVAAFEVPAPHIHLNMIGVRRSAQGQGLGRALLDMVHGLSDSDEVSTGVTLSTEVESNVPLYEHFGYGVIGSTEVESAFTSWTMFRPDVPRGAVGRDAPKPL